MPIKSTKEVILHELAKVYSEYLQTFSWNYMATITFRNPRRDSIYNGRQIWSVLDRECLLERAFFISEPHTTGFLHYHGLLALTFDPAGESLYNTRDVQAVCDKVFGRSRVESIRSNSQVANYCSKYVAKACGDSRTEYDFYGNWSSITTGHFA